MLDNKEEMQENLPEIKGISKTTGETTDTTLLSAILAELQEIKYILFAHTDRDNIEWSKVESV